MSTLISVRIDEELLQAMKTNALRLELSQTEYLRKAIVLLNRETEREERKKRLQDASLLVRKESMAVNAEFRGIEHDPET